MTDTEFKDYLERRCKEHPFDVPDFDAFFKEEELPLPHGEHRLIRLWPWIATTAAAAAVTFLLILLPVSKSPSTDNVWSETYAPPVSDACTSELAKETSIGVSSTTLALAKTDNSTDLLSGQSAGKSAEQAVSDYAASAEQVIGDGAAPAGEVEADNDFANSRSEETDPASGNGETVPASGNKRTASDAGLSSPVREEQWNRNILTAKSGKRKQIAHLSLSFNGSNALLAEASTNESTVSMITRNYQSGSILRGSTVNKNEWEVPGNLNLTRSEISAYTPVYNLPLSAGFGISIPLGLFWDLHTGLTYTYLSTNTYGQLKNSQSFSLYQHLHYVGIPLEFAFNILDNAFGLYISAGGGVEKGLAGVQYSNVYDEHGDRISHLKLSQSVAGFQPYASFKIGASYRIAPRLKVYAEPNFSYYFDTDQPVSVRTKHPFYIGFGAGIRFATGK